jgi:hypothetical protein
MSPTRELPDAALILPLPPPCEDEANITVTAPADIAAEAPPLRLGGRLTMNYTRVVNE